MTVLSRASRAAVAVCLIFFVAPLLVAEEPYNATGTMKVNGATTNLHHAYAYHDASDDTTRVLITNHPVTAALLAEESSGYSKGDGTSFRDLVKKGQFCAVELFVDRTNEVETVMVFDKAFDVPTPTSGHDFWYEPYKMTAPWTGGRSRTKQGQSFFKNNWEYDVTFFAPVGQKTYEIATAASIVAQHKEVAREAARVVPVGGGEEGAMYLAYRHNLETLDGKALLNQMTPSMQKAAAATMNVPSLDESVAGSWAFMQSKPDGKVDVVGGVRDPDGTTLELRKISGDRHTFGTAKIVKDHGTWKVAQEKWR